MKEIDSEKARLLRESHITGRLTIVIPDVAIYEVGNALRYEPEFSIKDVSSALRELYRLDLDIFTPSPEITNLITEIAYQNEITFYDASYIALAKELGLQFVTADEKLYQKARVFPFVELLSKMKIGV